MSDRLTLTRAGNGLLEVRRFFEDRNWGMTFADEELQKLAMEARCLARGESIDVDMVVTQDYIAWPGALDGALRVALKDVKHCGDYAVLWIHDQDHRIHLTMGDSDGDVEGGYTSFEDIRELIVQAVQPAWPTWVWPGNLEISDESHPYEEEGWRRIGVIGQEVPWIPSSQ